MEHDIDEPVTEIEIAFELPTVTAWVPVEATKTHVISVNEIAVTRDISNRH